MYYSNKLREKLSSGSLLYGTHIFCGSPSLTECIAMIGFDIMWIDMEHTAIGIEILQNNLIAARAGGTPAMVRIPWNDKILAKPVLDMGPDCILFPNVRTPDEAKAAAAACEYPPYGERGYGPLRALDYGAVEPLEYVTGIHRQMLRFIQIEDIAAVECLDDIVEVKGIDGYIVGPNDLSASLGHLGDTSNPEMMPVYDRISKIMKKHGKVFGVSVGYDPVTISQWRERGAKMIFSGSDVSYVYEGAASMLKKLCCDKNGDK